MRSGAVENSRERKGSGALFVGGLAAILASPCCLGPLLLVAVGLSGAWIGNLTRLEPYRPFFIGAAASLSSSPAAHRSASSRIRTRGSMRGALDSKDLQDSIFDSFPYSF